MALLEPLYPNLERFVRALVRRTVYDEEVAKDLLAETVAAAFEHFGSLRQPDALLSFLFTIATRLHRKQRKHAEMVVYAGDNEDWGGESYSGYYTENRADVATLYVALDKLPEKQREAVIMFEILGFSMKEIHAVQGGTLVSVKVRISRGRVLLGQLLGAKLFITENNNERRF